MPYKRLLALLLLVVACASTPGEPPPPTNPSQNLASFRGAEVEEITLSDGTRCAVVTSGYGQGISCDWGER